MINGNITIVAHKFNTIPSDDLVTYLTTKRAPNVLHIQHSFSDALDRRSSCRWYRDGTLVHTSFTRDYRRLPEPLVYLKELVFTLRWVIGSSVRWDHYIGMDGLCALFGLMARGLRRAKRVYYWSIDLVPVGRFEGRIKSRIYRIVNRFSALRADEMWDHTQRMVDEKERVLGLRPQHYRGHRVVPLGVWTDRIQRYSYAECEQHVLVFLGHLLDKQGVQLVVTAIPSIVEVIPDFQFKIMGEGSYEPTLRRLADELGVNEHVEFLGRVPNDTDVEKIAARCAAGIAPYVRSLDTFTQFGADPGKIKTYLGCGLPVLVTDVPWIARETEARGCGQIVSEDPADIAAKVIRLLTDGEVNQAYRNAAAVYSAEFDYQSLFNELKLWNPPPSTSPDR